MQPVFHNVLLKLQEQIDAAVKVLTDLKIDYKKSTGEDWVPEGGATARTSAVN